MPLDIELGVDLQVVDEQAPASAATGTDTGFLLTEVPVGEPQELTLLLNPDQARTIYPTAAALHNLVDGYFGCGGGRLFVAPLGVDQAADVAAFGPELGPGQLIAPSVVAAADQVGLRDWAWDTNRFFVAQAPDGATDAAVTTQADALISTEGRFAELEADFVIQPGPAGTTRDLPASVAKAAFMARSDRNTGNPNLAAAGNHTPGSGGASDYLLGIKNERSADSQKTLARAQVNCFRTVNGQVRAYGYWTLADLNVLPQWWDVSGSRTVMSLRAREQAVAEELMFGSVTADGLFLDKYKGALAGVCAELQRIGAIFGTPEGPGYNVDVSAAVNPLVNVARGLITARIVMKTSPFAAALPITLTRRAINESVA